MPYFVTDECELCGACVVGCASDAIVELETKAHINVELCIECGNCEMNCPSGAIIWLDEDELATPE